MIGRINASARATLALDSMRHADPLLPERRRLQILDAARECFAARGLSLTTIEDICGEARISPGALYRYFASKADIVAALAHEAHAEADCVLAVGGDPLTRLNELSRMTLGESAAFHVALWAEAAHDPPLARALAQRDARNRAALAALLAPRPDAETVADTLLNALDGLAQRRALGHFNFETAFIRFGAIARRLLD